MPKKILVQCASLVNKNAVKREVINGVEHIVISSFTLPDNVVMNGGMYPADEIAKSFQSLERTLAPIEHPTDANGMFLSASDPDAIHNFHGGAFNRNVRQENGRIHVEKVVNVVEANKSDKGKRLLDRIEELETNDNPRPIHTSTGVFLIPEDVEGLHTNDAGQEYTWIAREMSFDHDAILLDSVGAAQPSQGVGMAVNSDGEKCDVQIFVNGLEQETVTPSRPPEGELSHDDIEIALRDAIRNPPLGGNWVVRVFSSTFIFEADEQLFSAPYKIVEKKAVIMGIPLPVERDESFKPKVNEQEDDMKEVIVNALKAAKIETDGLDDAQLLVKYNELQSNQSDSDGSEDKDSGADIAAAVTNALKSLADELAGLKSTLNANADAELTKVAEIVGNSDKYPGLGVDAAKLLEFETLKGMAANCGTSFGIPMQSNSSGKDDAFAAPTADSLPE